MTKEKKVLLVGHCSPDSSYLTLAVRSICPDAAVQRVNDDTALMAHLEAGADLILVNRMMDGDFKDISGVNAIARYRRLYPTISAMLVSNYTDAQASAIANGAAPGFGKSEIGTPKARDALMAILGNGL